VTKNFIHDCRTGIGGPGRAQPSEKIRISENRIERTGDGIAFGHWSDVAIEDNVIKDMDDRGGVTHHDALQIFGDARKVRILRNVMAHSQHQLMIMQDGFGPVDDVLVDTNVIYDAGAYAIQSSGVTGLRFINNTVWKSGYGSLLLRRGNFPGEVGPSDTVVANNILYGLSFDRAVTAVRRNNLILRTPATPGDGEIYGYDPELEDPEGGDFRPRASSLALEHADKSFAGDTDQLNRQRPGKPTIGALEPRSGKCN
jgi:hypothetical protein